MIATNTEFQSTKRLIAELETEVADLEKLDQSPGVCEAIAQRKQHIGNLKAEIDNPDIPRIIRDEIDREIIGDLRAGTKRDHTRLVDR
jgi:hypothetical protein